MKKLVVCFGCLSFALGLQAWPGCHPCHPHHPGPPPPHFHHGWCGHHGDFWGRGGRNFWPGFVGGVVGGALASRIVEPATVVTTPVVVSQPAVVVQPVVAQPVVATTPVVTAQPVTTVQNVWVEGMYVDQVQANGSVVRVWSPGHYEQRSVVVR